MNNVLASDRFAVTVQVLDAAVPGTAFSGAFAVAPLPTTRSAVRPARAQAALSIGDTSDGQCRLAAQLGAPGIVKYPLDGGD